MFGAVYSEIMFVPDGGKLEPQQQIDALFLARPKTRCEVEVSSGES
jgi:hypothetical protein